MFKHEPESQEPHSTEAVATLAGMMGLASIPEVLKVSETVALVKGSNGYYSLTKKDGDVWRCTCKAASFGQICKHRRAFSAFMREESRKGNPSAFDDAGNIQRGRTGFRPVLEEVA
jgi:hypothetical protein